MFIRSRLPGLVSRHTAACCRERLNRISAASGTWGLEMPPKTRRSAKAQPVEVPSDSDQPTVCFVLPNLLPSLSYCYSNPARLHTTSVPYLQHTKRQQSSLEHQRLPALLKLQIKTSCRVGLYISTKACVHPRWSSQSSLKYCSEATGSEEGQMQGQRATSAGAPTHPGKGRAGDLERSVLSASVPQVQAWSSTPECTIAAGIQYWIAAPLADWRRRCILAERGVMSCSLLLSANASILTRGCRRVGPR